MKTILALSLSAIVAIGLLAVSGCSRGGGGDIDTSKVQAAFKNAPPVDKTEVENGVAAIKSENYPNALASLQKVAKSVSLTPEQKTALQDLITQVQAKMTALGQKALGEASDAAKQAGQGLGKAAEGVQKSLPK